MLYPFSEDKKTRLLTYPFIKKAASLHEQNRFTEKDSREFLQNLAIFEKQILQIISEREFNFLGTIGNNCSKSFEEVWDKKFSFLGKPHFQTDRGDSVFHEYSSKGWKLHIAFVKGKEKEIAKFLFRNGLYFKVEMNIGTYFYGHLQSGATLYIGSYREMALIAELIEKKIGHFLEMGTYYETSKGRSPTGSGSDIQIRPNIMARFDVQKSKWGILKGTKKYFEYGLPTWSGMGGIPILNKYSQQVAEVERKWNSYRQEQRDIYLRVLFKRVYEESKAELIKDFGKEFVFGDSKDF